jgi:hypothetical protein
MPPRHQKGTKFFSLNLNLVYLGVLEPWWQKRILFKLKLNSNCIFNINSFTVLFPWLPFGHKTDYPECLRIHIRLNPLDNF